MEKGEVTISGLNEFITDDRVSLEERQKRKSDLIPSAQIFREIFIEFLSVGEIDLEKLKKERQEYMDDASENFVLNEMVLDICMEKQYKTISTIKIERCNPERKVILSNIMDENGISKSLKCSDVELSLSSSENY